MEYRFVKTGAFAGETRSLGGYQFVDGVHTLGPVGDPPVAPSPADAKALGDYLAKAYQAYPEGSAELEAALKGQPTQEGKAPRQSDPNKARIAAVRDALVKLDPENDEHWTSTGLASVDAVRLLADNAELSRADITEAAPKLTREEARKAADALNT